MNRAFLFAAIAFLFSACATSPKLAEDAAQNVRTGSIAAAFYMEHKKINYNETIYRVLWNEDRAQESVFDGAWDIDGDMTATLAHSMSGAGYKVQPITNALNSKSLRSSFEQSILNTRNADQSNSQLSLSADVRKALLDNGVEYVVLLRSAYYMSQKYSGFTPQFVVPSIVITLDVANNRELSSGLMSFGGAISVEKSPREVEQNNLAKLKSATDGWVRKLGQEQLPKALGI